MELNLDRRKIKVKADGKDYAVFFPTARQIESFDKKYKDSSGDKSLEFEIIFNFLEELGLPKIVSENLDVFSLTDLLEYLSGKKKS